MNNKLLLSLFKVAQLQKVTVDRLELQEAVESVSSSDRAKDQLAVVMRHLALPVAKYLKSPDKSTMLALVFLDNNEWGVLRGHDAFGEWIIEVWDDESNQWQEKKYSSLAGFFVFTVNFFKSFKASKSPVYSLIRGEIFANKSLLFEALLGGIIINLVALATSLYTMQVYNRVVPTGAKQTLLVLSLGVFVAILFELSTKTIRMKLYEKLVALVDQRLSRTVFMRFLSIRLDQMPQSVGSLATQMRGYETVRSFLTTVTTHLMIDAPFSLLYGVVIFSIGGWLAMIPIAFFVVCVFIGLHFRKSVDVLAEKATAAANFKTGMLVETVEGAETIKSGQAGWRMLSRWMNVTDEAREYEQEMQRVSEHSQHLVASLQQVSYITLVASGALLITIGEVTMGGLIACSILSGRILAPVASIPRMLVQWAHTKAALQGLDRLWALQDDHHGQEKPITLEAVRGDYSFSEVVSQYGENKALSIPKLRIRAGEKIGVLGPVGAGKTTLLRLLTGMYKPQQGRILLDDIDLSHISKPILAESMGFLQQEGRLFAGTVRENLILGLLDPGDDVILDAARVTGLMQAVILPHPEGLNQQIHEGGTGLSGGQRQLVNLTRVYLAKPRIWLLDEPTASMDRQLERQVRESLMTSIKAEDTLVIVTHKPEMLALVNRILVVVNHSIALDGPKDEVLKQLNNVKDSSVESNNRGVAVS
ncbi:ATP-binding cassette domain-containing protein [Haliea sp. AH-315-K21]|uniref:ABC transporter n=1 Tax=SAR86 cluster bacterium TaxID=2030880 RepID=A0A2A5CDK4_9GAMM|nr:ATP-binding cassette domain-containing protein [Haliea sp. AH-315-K21]MBN4075223.1 ATP-binding cassette domain-containing protein [Gammaproteobacteria bacterium AH-315-E17]PCJ41842.1 MAG: ABC transporter [SAR86 cluster bacterium]